MRNNKIFLFLATFCLMAGVFTSCQKDSVTLRLRMASFSHDGKVHMDGYTPKWDTGSDLVCVNGETCTVSNNAVSVSPSIDYKAVYPASICGSLENVNGVGVYNLTIPEYQVYKTVPGSDIQVVEAPMGAHSNTSVGSADLYFKNLGALLAITVDNQAGRGDLIVDKIIVTSDSKPLWGSATLAMPDVTTQSGVYNPSYVINETDNNHQSVILAGNANGGSMNVTIAANDSKPFYISVPAFTPEPSNLFTIEVQAHNNSGEGIYRRAQATEGSGNIPLNQIGSLTFELTSSYQTSWIDNTRPAGALRVGEFSVSATKKVYFSAGNLQYYYASNAADRKFRIAEHQWDYAGLSFVQGQDVIHYGNVVNGNNHLASNNTNPNFSVQDGGPTEWIDLFGWGTSGHGTGNQAMPYDYLSDKTYGGTTTLDDNYDWGKKNTIYYGSQYSAPGVWRTLTQSEWEYMMGVGLFASGRTVAGGKGLGYTHSFVSVNGVPGLLIYPDGFSGTRVTNTINTTNSRISPVELTMNEFQSYENEGCAFLPCAGRSGNTSSTVGDPMATNLPVQEQTSYMGAYWLSSLNSGLPYYFEFGPTVTTSTNNNVTKGYGITTSKKFCRYSVRLVTDVPTNNTSK